MLGSEAYALEPIDDESEQELFLSILYHDAREGNAIRLLLGKDKDGKPYINHFANRDHREIGYHSMAHNAYASVNTFRSYKRSSDNVYNFSGIFIDLDYHGYDTEAELDRAIEKTKKRLRKAFSKGEISSPTMISDTGRGLGIFYILKTSIANTDTAKKSIQFLEQVRAALTARYKMILDGEGYLEVDTTVRDAARVCRMPLTLNQKVNRWCRLIHVSYDDDGEVIYYDLKQLAKENRLFDEIDKVRKEIAAKKIVPLDEYKTPFLSLRLKKLELLQETRGYSCHGCREYMVFIYYNAAKQIYGVTGGVETTRVFNEKFEEPLDGSELEKAFTSTDKNIPPTQDYQGFYKLPDSWVMETLNVTEEENRVCHFGSSRKQIERQHRKEQNQKRRKERNETIAGYIVAHPEETYPDIAATFGVSESMIYLICKEYDIRRNKVRGQEPDRMEQTETSESLKNLPQSSRCVFSPEASGTVGMPLADASTDGGAMVSDATAVALEGTVGEVSDADDGLDSVSGDMGIEMSGDFVLGRVDRDAPVPAMGAASAFDGLVQAYADLYGAVTEKRKKRKQISGQFGFCFGATGDVEYYMVS